MPRHALFPKRRRRVGRRRLLLVGAPVLVVVLVVAAWGIDTAAGGDVVRNVELDGTDLGGRGAAEARATVETHAAELAATPVRLVTPDGELRSTAGDLGLRVDVDATVERVLDAGRGPAPLRPLRWLASFVSPHEVEPVVDVDVDTAYHEIIGLEGERRIPPVEPTFAIGEERVELVPSEPGSGIDVHEVAERLPSAVLAGADTVVLTLEPIPLPPATSDEQMQALVDEANVLTDVPLVVEVEGHEVEVPPAAQRGWLRLVGDPGAPELTIDEETALDELAELFPELGEPPVDATVTLEGDTPVIVPGQPGTACCEPGSGELLLAAMREGRNRVSLAATSRPPDVTTEDIESWGIVQPVGGARAWPESRADEVGAGFTTFHAAGEARVTNIHRIADLVRGAVIPPGESFSINDHVGRRTRENGFVAAGAIRNGQHVSEVGGGVSQFATTLFNAAYFAGLDIPEYQAHSEYFSRYPRGREATMGYPAPDLRIVNNTTHGILIWTSYTASSLTVTLWSTPYATAEQTGVTESRAGNCTVVRTERTRTFPDGSTDVDTFSATYRPGEGQFC